MFTQLYFLHTAVEALGFPYWSLAAFLVSNIAIVPVLLLIMKRLGIIGTSH